MIELEMNAANTYDWWFANFYHIKTVRYRLKSGRTWYTEIALYDYATKNPIQLSRDTGEKIIIRVVPDETMLIVQVEYNEEQ